MFTRLQAWINDHHSAILATIVLLQNVTPFGKELHAVLRALGDIVAQS